MKTLILYTNFGNGHKSAAYNMASKIKGDVFLHNPRKEQHPLSTKFIEKTYEVVFLKNSQSKIVSKIYGFLYSFINKSNLLLNVFVKNTGNKRVKELIKKYNPDVIISTFPQKIKTDIPVFITITDYDYDTCWFLKKEDFYTVNTLNSIDALTFKGVNKENIYLSGIPIKEEFKMENNNTKVKNILFNLGAKGYCNYKVLCDNIDKLLLKDYNVEVMTGNNNELFLNLNEKYVNKIVVYPFIKNVSEVIKKSDLIVTKAGGLSLTECIYSSRPMIINTSQSLGGQEESNFKFILEKEIGLLAKNKDISECVLSIESDKYKNMVKNMMELKKEYEKYDIVSIIEGKVNGK